MMNSSKDGLRVRQRIRRAQPWYMAKTFRYQGGLSSWLSNNELYKGATEKVEAARRTLALCNLIQAIY